LKFDVDYGSDVVAWVRKEGVLGRLVSGRFAQRCLRWGSYKLGRLTILGAQYADLPRYAGAANQSDGGGLGTYADEGDVRVLLRYRTEVRAGLPENNEAGALYAAQERLLVDLLTRRADLTGMFNFGVCYGHIDSLLARRFPDRHFAGIDLSPLSKTLNDADFADVPNLSFHAGDVFEHLKRTTYPGGLLFSSRTLVFLSKEKVGRLYAAAREAGIAAIAGTEIVGISRATGQPYSFGLDERPSVPYRGGMIIHNYPELLNRAGFSMTHWEVIKTGHVHPDYRIVAFTAERC
jgi:hypothetical protein